MSCPFLTYRESADGANFDEARAYCEAEGRFVQPMRADVCNDRFDLDHAADCEIYLDHASDGDGAKAPEGDEP
ncbi:hypothetical protein HZS55_12680 [Halosimplex rubrum]|uniref:Uncharacterized protein n=1 Tax=Halosimplex rubrum TaxID=869889 RepID=A0A7D5P0T4_9EURY|nr:hypothetical protein [Halosimplex rubrum]QLH78106.1 hypothetical protein HZS55_12680 [Halosimplex rubrum]